MNTTQPTSKIEWTRYFPDGTTFGYTLEGVNRATGKPEFKFWTRNRGIAPTEPEEISPATYYAEKP